MGQISGRKNMRKTFSLIFREGCVCILQIWEIPNWATEEEKDTKKNEVVDIQKRQ